MDGVTNVICRERYILAEHRTELFFLMLDDTKHVTNTSPQVLYKYRRRSLKFSQ